jgi:hypothetical protein
VAHTLTMASGESIPMPLPTPINRERRTGLLCHDLLDPTLFPEAPFFRKHGDSVFPHCLRIDN